MAGREEALGRLGSRQGKGGIPISEVWDLCTRIVKIIRIMQVPVQGRPLGGAHWAQDILEEMQLPLAELAELSNFSLAGPDLGTFITIFCHAQPSFSSHHLRVEGRVGGRGRITHRLLTFPLDLFKETSILTFPVILALLYIFSVMQ